MVHIVNSGYAFHTECNGRIYVDMLDYTQNTCCRILHRYNATYLQTSNNQAIVMNVKVKELTYIHLVLTSHHASDQVLHTVM